MRAAPALKGFAAVLVVAASAGCFPNPDALRPSSSSGSGGASTPAGGATGSGGVTGIGGHTGAGGSSSGAGGTNAPGSGGRIGAGGGTTGAGGTSSDGGGTSSDAGTSSGAGGSTTGAGGMTTGAGGGAGSIISTGLVLTPDATGFIAAASNTLGVTGSWYAFCDGIGSAGTSNGACETAGHPATACSTFTNPPPAGQGFPNTGAKMCVQGVAARVVDNATTGMPDFGGIYGVTIGFDFNYPALGPPKGVFNAIAGGITGIQFDIDLVPANGMRVQFVTPGTDLGPGGPSYWGGAPSFPQSPVVAGTNRIYWADVTGPYGLGLDPTQLVSMYFNVPAVTTGADSFRFCISNVTLIRDAGPLGRTCPTATFPVFCPATANGVAANCWTAGTNCNTLTNCAGVLHSCFGQAQTDYYDCTQQMCFHCSGAGPLACPALGTVPGQCWPAGIACSTVTDCGFGDYEACSDPSKTVDCDTLTCG